MITPAMTRAGLATLVLATTSALAQEPPASADLLDAFIARCEAIAADPRAIVNALKDGDGEAAGGMTSDGAMAQVTEPMPQGEDDLQVILFFNQVVVEGAARQGCSLTAYGFSGDGPMFADMANVVGGQAEAILGSPAVRAGGSVLGGTPSRDVGLGQLLLWHRQGAGAGGPVLTLAQDARTVSLTLARVVPVP